VVSIRVRRSSVRPLGHRNHKLGHVVRFMFVSFSGKKWRAIPSLLIDDVDGLRSMRVHVITNRKSSVGKLLLIFFRAFPRLVG